jgi:HD superfamily phosphohydrolase
MSQDHFDSESLISDPLHGYITFTAARGRREPTEQTLIDHPWVQRLRRIHQLQSAWWVYPSAEHTRFQHVLGAMHLGSRAVSRLYPSLVEACRPEPVPSRVYVDSLVRLAALLHDVGHGPFGHFFDDHFLSHFGLTHEDLGQRIITTELADLIRGIRENPHGRLGADEILQPDNFAFVIKRPTSFRSPSEPGAISEPGALATGEIGHVETPLAYARGSDSPPRSGYDSPPRWLQLLQSLFSGVYTVDNMDFVLRDSYMSGHGPRAFDLDRLLHYSFFTPNGLTLHVKGLDSLIHFIEARGELFRTLYFHRTVRAIDLSLADVFGPTMELLFPSNPADHLDRYRQLTEWSLLVDVERWAADADSERRRLGQAWQAILRRQIRWKMACERTIPFEQGQPELASIFTDAALVEQKVRSLLPGSVHDLAFRADVARHYHRPISSAAARFNFVFEPATNQVRPLSEHSQVARLPVSFSLCRLYAQDQTHAAELARALDHLLQARGDEKTNM